jgi:multiple sugar transport system permease protein
MKLKGIPLSKWTKWHWLFVVSSLIVIIGTLTMLFPYIWMIATSFKSRQEAFELIPTLIPQQFQLTTYREIWTTIPIIGAVLNTLAVEFSVILVGTFVSSLAAFSFAKMRLPHKNFFLILLLSAMMIPYAALLLPQYQAYERLQLTNTLWPLIIPGFFGNVSMMFFLIQYMKGIPSELVEAAKIDGASHFGIYARIVVPLSLPALAAQVIFWFVGIWNDYFAPSIYLTIPERQTLQPLLASLNSAYSSGTNFPLIMTGAVLASIPMIVIFIIFQRFFIESMALTGVKG